MTTNTQRVSEIPFAVKVGETLELRKQPYVVEKVYPGQVALEHEKTSVACLLTFDELRENYMNGTLRFSERSATGAYMGEANDNCRQSFDLAPEASRKIALQRAKYCRGVRHEYPNRIKNDDLKSTVLWIAAEESDPEPPSNTRMRDFLREWDRSNGDVRALMPKKRGRKKGRKLLKPPVLAKLHEALDTCYLQRQAVSVVRVMNKLHELVEEYNNDPTLKGAPRIEVPNERTVRRVIKEYLRYDLAVARKGKKIADKEFGPVYENHRKAEHPLQVVQMDTKTLDVFVLKDDGTAARPYLTLALDEYSRCVVGYYIGFEKPCADNVLKCLYNAILPKQVENQDEY